MKRGLTATLGVALLAAIVAGGCGGDDDEGPASSATAAVPGNGTITVVMKDNFFEPKAITVSAGAKVTFELRNDGKAIHNMRIADAAGSYTGKDSVISTPELQAPKKPGQLVWNVPAAAGAYKFRCDIHPVEMVGVITVK